MRDQEAIGDLRNGQMCDVTRSEIHTVSEMSNNADFSLIMRCKLDNYWLVSNKKRCICDQHTKVFSDLDRPARFNSMSFIPQDKSHSGSLSRSSAFNIRYIVTTKSDLEARSDKSSGSFETRAAKNARMASSTWLT